MEIKVSDLRIYNYLDIEGRLIKVGRVEEGGFISFKIDEDSATWNPYLHITQFKPIPITEEWVVNLGFEWYEPLKHYRFVDEYDVWYQINVKEDNVFVFTFTALNYDEVNHMPPKVINYVHQLQNLFYFLAGKELKYKK